MSSSFPRTNQVCGNQLNLDQIPGFPLAGFPVMSTDDSGRTSGNINGVTFTGGTWTNSGTEYEYATGGWIQKKGSASGYTPTGGYLAKTNTVEVCATIRRESATVGNVFLMAGFNTSTTYYIAGHHGTNGYQIWRNNAGSLTALTTVANTWTAGEERTVKMVYELVPGNLSGNGAKVVIGLYVNDVLVATAVDSSVPGAISKNCGFWMDNVSIANVVKLKNFTVKEPKTKTLVVIGDSLAAGSAGVSSASLAFPTITSNYLGWSLDNRGTGGATLTEYEVVQLPAFLATNPTPATVDYVLVIGPPTNNIDRGASTQEMLNCLKRLCDRARATGVFKGIGVIEALPQRTITLQQQQRRKAYNKQLRSRWTEFCDGISVVSEDPILNADTASYTLASGATATDGTFTDALHPNDYGHRILAGYVADLAMRVGGN